MCQINREMRGLAIVLTAAIAMASFVFRPSRTVAQTPATRADIPGLAVLEQERITDLSKAAAMQWDLYNKGLNDFDGVCDWNERLLDAEMQYTPSSKDRIDILHKELDNAKAQEDAVASREKAGIGSPTELAGAQAFRLEIQIKLLQETAK